MARIAGRYEVVAQLDEGGMGVVFRAYDPPPMDRYVAVKTLSRGADPQSLSLFYKECAALKSLSHPNIVEIFDMGEFEEGGFRKPFFVMPLLTGQTLQQLIQDTSRLLTVERVVEIFVQISRGLQAAHEHGLIHRDLKPSNIFVLADDAVKIIDFGVARVASMESRATVAGAGGTLAYMAPEVLQHKPVSVLSDVYSLGVTLYEALTRQQPYLEATEDATANAILTRIPSIASDLNPAVSHLISRVAHKAMAKQPKSRFESAREFSVALQKAARNESIAAFEPARTRVRIRTAARALDKGQHELASEIVTELEAEGEIDPELKVLRTRIDRMSRRRRIDQLLESARAYHEHDEDGLALLKLDEILQLDPANAAAIGLKSQVEDRLSARQLEPWIQAARQRKAERSYERAREALRNALALRPKDSRVARLLAEIEQEEQKHFRLRQQKEEAYQSAVRAWTDGDVRQALSQMRTVLDLDGVAPEPSPETTAVYQDFYERIRTEHEAWLARNPDPAPAPAEGLSQGVTFAVPEHPRWASRRIGVMVAAAVAIALIVRALLTGGAPPPEPASVGPVRVEPRARTAGALAIRQLPPGLRVSLDGSPIGLVGDDGTLSYAGVPAGTHVLQFTGAGYVTTSISRNFAAGGATTVTAADVALSSAPAPIQFVADADTDVTLVRQGTVLQTFKGPTTLQMAEGDYRVSVKGPAGVTTSRALIVSAGVGQIVDTNALLVRGMERFPTGWRTSDTWFARRGGGLSLYDQRTTNGEFRFTVRLDGSGNPFSSGDRLTWVVGYVDERNHVRIQLDRRSLYRTDIIDGQQQSETIPHSIPTNLPFVHLSMRISGARLVHQFSTDGSTWKMLDAWTRTRPPGQRDAGRPMPLDGKFGFVLPENEEVFLSNFVYDPRSR